MFTAWAIEVAKCDAECSPLVVEHHQDTVGMIDMSTCHSDARLLPELTRVADSAKLAFHREHGVAASLDTLRIKAGWALRLSQDSLTLVVALQGPAAELDFL